MTTQWYTVDGVQYQSEEFYHQHLETIAKLKEMVATSGHKYPDCQFGDQWELSCDCARSDILGYELIGCPHNVAVGLAGIGQALMIRQYGFDGHDDSFDSFDTQFVETNYPNDPQLYIQWVAENQPAVQWAIDFADLRPYL